MDKFLEKHKLQKLVQGEIDNLYVLRKLSLWLQTFPERKLQV